MILIRINILLDDFILELHSYIQNKTHTHTNTTGFNVNSRENKKEEKVNPIDSIRFCVAVE